MSWIWEVVSAGRLLGLCECDACGFLWFKASQSGGDSWSKRAVFTCTWCHLAGFLWALKLTRTGVGSCGHVKFSYRDDDEFQFSLKWKCNFWRRELSFSVKASSYSCNYMILTRHCGYILKLLPLFLIILPFCTNTFFSSAMADCSFWDWFSLRGIWWKQSFAYISRPKLGRLRSDPAALLPADDNLSTPRVAWMKAGAGWQIKQTTFLLSCLIFLGK